MKVSWEWSSVNTMQADLDTHTRLGQCLSPCPHTMCGQCVAMGGDSSVCSYVSIQYSYEF